MTPRRLLRAAGTVLLLAPALAAQEPVDAAWPHWRGPARDGVSHETGWSPAGRAAPLWRAELGLGYSNVAIADGRLFTLGFDEAAGMDRLFCLDAETGEERWRLEWPAEIRANFHGGGTLTTPAIDGDVVFVSSREGRCMALAVEDGRALWQRNYTEELGLKVAFHGFAASPLVLADRLVLVLGGIVLAVDKRSGDLRWRTADHGDGGYSTPVPFELQGRLRLCVYLGIGPVVLDAETGEEVHRYPWKPKAGGVNVCTPIVFGNKIFVSSAYDQGAALLELGDEPQPRLLWRSRRMRNKVSGCTLWQGHVYGFDESMLKCIDLDGEEKWRVRGLGMGSVAVAGGRLIVLGSKGELLIAEASPDGFRQLSKRKVLDGGVYWTTPVLLNGLIYCRNSLGSLVCLDHRPAASPETAAAARPAPAVELPAAERLFAAHARAIGGERLRARRSQHVEGTFEKPGDGITRTAVRIDRAAPDRWRMSYDVGSFGTVHHAYDGEIGWVLDPFYGNELLEGDELREVRETMRLHAPLEWKTGYTRLETTGSETFADRACWVVAATSSAGARRRFYFDRDTGLLVGHDGEGESMVVHAGWRDFDGVRLPTRTTTVAPETGAEQVLRIERVTWDEVSPDAFARPAAVARMLRTPAEVEAASAAARARYAAYLGTYTGEAWSGVEEWQVTVADGDLAIVFGEGSPTLLHPKDTEHLFALGQFEGYEVEFRLGDGGAVRGLVLRGGGEEYEFERR